jgi:hypothetical protein
MMDRRTDKQTETLIQVGMGNLIRFLQVKCMYVFFPHLKSKLNCK